MNGNVDHGVFMWTTTVCESGASIPVIGVNACPMSAEAFAASRSPLTAAASTGVPSWKVTPGRRVIVHVVKVLSEVIDSARYGFAAPSGSTAISGSNTALATA